MQTDSMDSMEFMYSLDFKDSRDSLEAMDSTDFLDSIKSIEPMESQPGLEQNHAKYPGTQHIMCHTLI